MQDAELFPHACATVDLKCVHGAHTGHHPFWFPEVRKRKGCTEMLFAHQGGTEQVCVAHPFLDAKMLCLRDHQTLEPRWFAFVLHPEKFNLRPLLLRREGRVWHLTHLCPKVCVCVSVCARWAHLSHAKGPCVFSTTSKS